jgi:hypothetical protein
MVIVSRHLFVMAICRFADARRTSGWILDLGGRQDRKSLARETFSAERFGYAKGRRASRPMVWVPISSGPVRIRWNVSSGGAVQYYSTGLRVRSCIQEFERARFAGSLGTIAFRDSHRDRRILRLEVSVGYY